MLLKYFLKQRGLNSTYTGGIGSFLLFCMVVSAVQQHPAHRNERQHYGRYTLAHYLLHFLQLYGETFRYSEVGISIRGDGSYFQKRGLDWDRADSLYVECPQNANTDLGRGAYKIEYTRKAFLHAYRLLCAQNYQHAKTPLQIIVRVDEVLQTRVAQVTKTNVS